MKKFITILMIIAIIFSIFAIYTVSNAADEETDTTTDTWTDFSNAKFELKRDGVSEVYVEITGVKYDENSIYSCSITNNSNKPDIDMDGLLLTSSNDYINVGYNKETKNLETGDIAKYYELNQDLYISIIETKSGNSQRNNVVTYGNKLTRLDELKYYDAFWATFISDDMDQIDTNFIHDKSNARKIQIKVGKISDTSILQKIKNEDSNGFSELLNFAKSNSAIYNQNLNADNNSQWLSYHADSDSNTDNSLISLKGLENKQYYYLYVKTDDENGKYISDEAVTLSQANVSSDTNEYWSLFFYGSNDFQWANFNGGSTPTPTTPKTDPDETVAPTILPKTGLNAAIIAGTLGIAMLSIVLKKKYNNYKDI